MQKYIDSYDFAGKKAIVRVDFNVPLDENFKITDDTRIRAAIPTLKKVLAEGGSVIIMFCVRAQSTSSAMTLLPSSMDFTCVEGTSMSLDL